MANPFAAWAGVPLDGAPPPPLMPNQQQQQQPQQQWMGFGGNMFEPMAVGRGGPGGGRGGRGAAHRGRGARARGYANATPRNIERTVDELITRPNFWATVFATLRDHPDFAQEIRRDLEEQERHLVDEASEGRRHDSPRRGDEVRRQQQNDSGGGGRGEAMEEDEREPQLGNNDGMAHNNEYEGNDNNGYDRGHTPPPQPPPHRAEDLPELYDYLNGDLDNIRRTAGVQSLEVLMDQLDIGALWSARDVTISFGPLTRVLLRLFIGPYGTDEEKMIVRMLNLGVERATREYGFQDGASRPQHGSVVTEPFIVTYRRRGRMLRDFAAFRYMLQIAENMGRIGRKNKNDLILLYLTLTTPEVRLHRKWSADDRDQVISFRDIVTGYSIGTPPVMARPMSIEMRLDSVFGNVSMNPRLLDRALSVALNNRNRKVSGLNAAQEVEMLMENSRLLNLSDSEGAPDTVALKPFTIQREHAALRRMLEMSTVVSMMAEEYRVFVAGAPPSRAGREGGTASASKRSSSEPRRTNSRQLHMFRRPIFFTFKPTSQAVANKDK